MMWNVHCYIRQWGFAIFYFCEKLIINKLLIIVTNDVVFFLSRASNPKDPPTVTQAREQELELIQKFIQ